MKLRCIFCKQQSDNSRSVEHIIPESLGNTTQTLPPGVVCDKCNNYFARKVEKVFLESPAVMALRFHQAIPNKKGSVPPLDGLLLPNFPIIAHRHLKGPVIGSIDVDPEAFQHLKNSSSSKVILPSGGEAPDNRIISRFLAKAGLEAMAQRVLDYEGGVDYIVNETQLDPIRNHARRGDIPEWPHYSRSIYDANKKWSDDNTSFQVVHEYDFLTTNAGEMYFVLAIFGLELTVNMAGPYIDGYLRWLDEHKYVSPLYSGKNSEI